MKRYKKQEMLQSISMLKKANDAVVKTFHKAQRSDLEEALVQCQETAILLGTYLETLGEEGISLVHILEEYCENIYQMSQSLQDESICRKISKKVQKQLVQVENGIKFHLPVRREVVFLPYKASMWDSLESVYLAAREDENCDAYIIPIPYYDKNPDGTFKEEHYEADLFPDYVPITDYKEYDFEERRPDMVFIHNPYDQCNFVTSVHPFFYSGNLKQYTDTLVYIPYYATAGGMSEAQSQCIAYYYVDYIVIQAEKYRKFFAADIPDEKFLALGSPKFDSVIRKCANPSEAPAEWLEKMTKADGTKKKVYFYNTSLNGMLGDTPTFLKKMQYVFETFKGRDDVCLLWRPHPLLESTFDSMRAEYKPVFNALKKEFFDENLGIYDDTPGIENTIALSDVYVGDDGTSVTSLFGVAGKPLFILNNYINTLPDEDDWRGEILNPVFDMFGDDRFHVSSNNKLWYSENNDYYYKFYMDLETGYSGGNYYMKALQKGDKVYVIPWNAQHLLVIKDKKIIQKIEFKDKIIQSGAFYSYWHTDGYLFLIPFKYPHLIRYEISTDEVRYVDGVSDFAARNIDGEWCMGGVAQYGDELVIASPEDNKFLFIHMDTLETKVLSSNTKSNIGTQTIVPDGESLWLLPLKGMTLINWNPKTGEVREYNDRPDDFKSIQFPFEMEVTERPFGNIAVSRQNGKENIVISPYYGNMYVSLDPVTGKMTKWETGVGNEMRGKNGYYLTGGMGGFTLDYTLLGSNHQHMWYAPERKLYDIDIETRECKEMDIVFDYGKLVENEAGFMEESEWLQYCCKESAFNTLQNLLNDTITGNRFDRDRQIEAFAQINASTSGNCGELVYRYLRDKE